MLSNCVASSSCASNSATRSASLLLVRQKLAAWAEAEAEVVDLHRQLAEMAAAMEEIEDERLALLARVAELEATLGRLDALAPDYELPDGAAVAEAIASGYILTAGCRDIHGKVAGVAAVERNNEMLRPAWPNWKRSWPRSSGGR